MFPTWHPHRSCGSVPAIPTFHLVGISGLLPASSNCGKEGVSSPPFLPSLVFFLFSALTLPRSPQRPSHYLSSSSHNKDAGGTIQSSYSPCFDGPLGLKSLPLEFSLKNTPSLPYLVVFRFGSRHPTTTRHSFIRFENPLIWTFLRFCSILEGESAIF